jgi:polar amino acid transport system permease protein
MGVRAMNTSLWDWAYAQSVLPSLLEGLKITVFATVIGSAIAVIFGFVLAMARLARIPILSLLIWFLVEFLRGTPFLVQLYFVFYVLPNYGILFSPLTTGIVALGIYGSARAAELYRAALETVPLGQWEACLTLGLPLRRVWSGIIFPQMWPIAVPMLGNLIIAMFKDTAILSTITVLELVARAKDAGFQSFRYLEPLTIAGILFWAVSYPAARGLRLLEARHAD